MTDTPKKPATIIRMDGFKLHKNGLSDDLVEKALAAKDAGLHEEFRIRSLGFPDKVVKETMRAKEKGLFDIKPSPDLVDKIMERCKPLLPKPPRQE